MKNTKKIAAIAAMAMLGIGGLATATQTNPTVVQAATKKKSKKSKVHRYKKVHVVMSWGITDKSHNVDASVGDNVAGPTLITGYRYVNGQKQYLNANNIWESNQDLRKPTLYTAQADIPLHDVGAGDGIGVLGLTFMDAGVIKKGTTIGIDDFAKPVNVNYYSDPDTNKRIKFTGKKTVYEHSPWMHDLNDLSKYEIEGTWHIEAGKYMALTLPNGNIGFIKLSDAAKLKKGGSAKAFKKLQKESVDDYISKVHGRAVAGPLVKGGIKDAQFF